MSFGREVECLQRAWERRLPLFAEGKKNGTNAFRLFCGGVEGIAGLTVDRYDRVLVLQIHEGKGGLSDAQIQSAAEWYLGRDGIRSIYVKKFVPDRSRSVADLSLHSENAFLGESAPVKFPITENGFRFLIRPYDGFSTGLFLDQRRNRLFLQGRSHGKKVLNCFSYTCAFSVYSAAAGGRVTSVDLSRKYLEWGKENFLENGLAPESHRFFPMDIFRFLKAARNHTETYDLVIVDPPSFSRNRQGETFSLKRDLGRLLRESASVVRPGGEIFFSVNYLGWDRSILESAACNEWCERRPRLLEAPNLPEDYAHGPDPISYIMAVLK